MNIQTFRAKTLQQALRRVRSELGPDAAILHTREVGNGWLGRLLRRREYEVAASASLTVPTQSESAVGASTVSTSEQAGTVTSHSSSAHQTARRGSQVDIRGRDSMQGQLEQMSSMLAQLCEQRGVGSGDDLPQSLFGVFTDMIEAEVDETLARQLIQRVRQSARPDELTDPLLAKTRAARMLEEDIRVSGPIAVQSGQRRIAALVGPTGVGKTTTIAKLAANFRLREKIRVGLITVDTYRIAAVEQLRTYADIIDLPMEVVATPREMREALDRLQGQDLVLMDTAGRSPRDEVKIRELRSLLSEAQPDEVHLVLSSSASARQLINTAQQFAEVGTTSMLLTKLDEAAGLGHVLSLLDEYNKPISYLTDGQNVPDDIRVATKQDVAQMLLAIGETDAKF